MQERVKIKLVVVVGGGGGGLSVYHEPLLCGYGVVWLICDQAALLSVA